jgi:hypothetical protein
MQRFSNSSTTLISSSKSGSILSTPQLSHSRQWHPFFSGPFTQDLSHLRAPVSMTVGLESYIICWLQPVLFYCLAYIFLTEEETKRSIHVDNMPFSVGFYYCIKRKRLVYIEILNLGLERDLKFFSLYASKRALTSTSTFSFPYTLIPCFYMLDNGH